MSVSALPDPEAGRGRGPSAAVQLQFSVKNKFVNSKHFFECTICFLKNDLGVGKVYVG